MAREANEGASSPRRSLHDRALQLQRDLLAGKLAGWLKVELEPNARKALRKGFQYASEFTFDAADVSLRLEGSGEFAVFVNDARVGLVEGAGLSAGSAPGRIVRRRKQRPEFILLVRVAGAPDPIDELLKAGLAESRS